MGERKYQQVWKLDSKGSYNEKLTKLVKQLEDKLHHFTTPRILEDAIHITELLTSIAEVRVHLSQTSSIVSCLMAQNSNDQTAVALKGEVLSINARFDSCLQRFIIMLADTNESTWKKIIDSELLRNYRFILNEWKENRLEIFDNEQIITNFMADGYHAWGDFYHALIGKIIVNIGVEGKENKLSVGQAINLRSHPNEDVRRDSFFKLEGIWEENEEVFAKVLNHISGYRLQDYHNRGVDDVLAVPLIRNRLKKETLRAMWKVVDQSKQPFIDYLNQKAIMIGGKKLHAYNFWAPLSRVNHQIEYRDAVEFILKQFSTFGDEMESFSRQAFEKGWIEAEDRSNKSTVAFCAGFPVSEESRVFMTYGGSITNVLTLAHELGHAFHNYAMKGVDGINRQYPMCIAETASTFSEMIILDAAKSKAKSDEEKLFFLDEKLKRSVMNFMNMHVRFLFEKKFYEERKTGIVPSERLNELMEEALNKGYEGSLASVSVHSWVWTPHFYLTKVPFYNFPYTFGYLFALCLYAKSKEVGKEFEMSYLELLRDSGSMTMEALVRKHLNEDITKEDFWEKGIKLCLEDVEEFIMLSHKLTK
ncbi:M3 family oligoendopeptidase [Ornithinibacillus xuwenensis]|uniref:M3 family oligoendopeptidase n=1 Tax=Ornithinibacillus xuwenensis TaxID=3144668 RepID=A0ABU9XBJ9_9BACI